MQGLTFIKVASFAAVCLLTACCSNNNLADNSNLNASTDSRYLTRFTADEAKSLESGKVLFTSFGNGSNNSPSPALASALGDYTVAAETKYFIASRASQGQTKSAIISLAQNVADWQNQLDVNGAVQYTKSIPVDSDGNQIQNSITGVASAQGDDFFVSIASPQVVGESKATFKVSIADNNGVIHQKTVNDSDIIVKILFVTKTVVSAGNSLTKTEFYPYKNGYLVYSTIKIKGASSFFASKMGVDNVKNSLFTARNLLLTNLP